MTFRSGMFLGLGLLIAFVVTGSLYLLLFSHKLPVYDSPIVASTVPPPQARPAPPADPVPAQSPQPHVEKTKDGVYLYNDRGQLTAITNPNGSVYVYMYDAYGNKIREGSGPGKTWTYLYDTNHHLVSVTNPQGQVTH